jgi:hypothetical protein
MGVKAKELAQQYSWQQTVANLEEIWSRVIVNSR